MLGFNAMFHLFSLVLFAGIFFYVLKLKKKQSLIRRVLFASNERTLVSPQELLRVFEFCFGLEADGVNDLTAKVSSNKKILATEMVRTLQASGVWSVASNGLVFRPDTKAFDEPKITAALKSLEAFLGCAVDIIEPS